MLLKAQFKAARFLRYALIAVVIGAVAFIAIGYIASHFCGPCSVTLHSARVSFDGGQTWQTVPVTGGDQDATEEAGE